MVDHDILTLSYVTALRLFNILYQTPKANSVITTTSSVAVEGYIVPTRLHTILKEEDG